MNEHEWNWYNISMNIGIEDVINNPNEKWDRHGLSFNRDICMKVIKMNLPNATGYWNWEDISGFVQMDDVIKNPNEEWNRYYLSHNRNITLDVVIMDLPNAIDEWEQVIYENISISENTRDIITTDSIKRETRWHMSMSSDISIFWIRFKDRVGISRYPKWNSDIEIVCKN
jgi:hypothetical protein